MHTLVTIILMGIDASIFREGDIRGEYPKQINEDIAHAIGKAAARLFTTGPVLIARDGRLSSPQLEEAIYNGLKAAAPNTVEIIRVGLSTTPMFYFLINDLQARGGIMITASHNPKQYNGMKIVGEGAAPYSGLDIKTLL